MYMLHVLQATVQCRFRKRGYFDSVCTVVAELSRTYHYGQRYD